MIIGKADITSEDYTFTISVMGYNGNRIGVHNVHHDVARDFIHDLLLAEMVNQDQHDHLIRYIENADNVTPRQRAFEASMRLRAKFDLLLNDMAINERKDAEWWANFMGDLGDAMHDEADNLQELADSERPKVEPSPMEAKLNSAREKRRKRDNPSCKCLDVEPSCGNPTCAGYHEEPSTKA